MAETKSQRIARSYIAGAIALLEELQYPAMSHRLARDLVAPIKMLEDARELVDHRDVEREKIAERVRERFSKPKSKPKLEERIELHEALEMMPAYDGGE